MFVTDQELVCDMSLTGQELVCDMSMTGPLLVCDRFGDFLTSVYHSVQYSAHDASCDYR